VAAIDGPEVTSKASDLIAAERSVVERARPTDGTAPTGLPVPSWRRRLSRSNPTVVDALAMLGVLVLLAFLWGRGRGIWYWGDEGLAVGISSHPLADIPTLLRQDGSPPLYYWLLHVWTTVFGSTEAQTHGLSLIFALGSVGAAWWLGRSLFGRRVGWFLVALTAVNPLLAVYANETRMYTLMVLLATLVVGSFLHVFVFRRRRYLPLLAVSLVLLLYTHNWALLLAVGAAAALVPCVLTATDRRRVMTDACLVFGAAALFYLPWVPTLLFQRAHTAAPWVIRPTLDLARDDIADLVGGANAVIALGLGAGVTLVAMARRPWNRAALAVGVAALLALVTVGLGWAASQSTPAWTFRYLSVVVPAVLLVAAVGLAGGGRLAISALCVLAFLQAPIDVKVPPHQKSNVKAVAAETAAQLRPGDLVVSHFGEIPILAHYLPPGLRYASAEGVVPDERIADYRDSTERLRGTRPSETLAPLLDALPEGGHVLLVCPIVVQPEPERTEFLQLVEDRCNEMKRLLADDTRLKLDRSIPAPVDLDVRNTMVDASLLTKQAPSA